MKVFASLAYAICLCCIIWMPEVTTAREGFTLALGAVLAAGAAWILWDDEES